MLASVFAEDFKNGKYSDLLASLYEDPSQVSYQEKDMLTR